MIRRIALLNRTSDRFPAWLSFSLFARPVSKVDRDPSMAFGDRVENSAGNPNGSLNPVSQPLKGWVAATPDRVADGADAFRLEESQTFFREIRMPRPGWDMNGPVGLILFRS